MTNLTAKSGNSFRRGGRFFALLTFCLALPAQAVADEAAAVADLLLKRSNAVVTQLTGLSEAGQLDSQAALKTIQSEMSPILDFAQLTKRAMGKHWKKADEAQRARVTDAFRALLENTYAKLLTKYSGQQVSLVEAKAIGDKGDISVLLRVGDGRKTADIDYIFTPTDASGAGGHLVGDIKVEGVSMVANYRRQFSSAISKEGVDGLVTKLQALAEKKLQ